MPTRMMVFNGSAHTASSAAMRPHFVEIASTVRRESRRRRAKRLITRSR